MGSFPETRASLILRIADARDALAWDEFAQLYQPVIYRLARRQGMQHADAEELTQEVLVTVARAVEGWVPDPERGRFRSWLFRIARNLIINSLTRRKVFWNGGGSDARRLLDGTVDSSGALTELIELEYRREVFRCAAKRVQTAVAENTWQAFWLTAVEDCPVEEVARRLGMSVGSVYIARSRVMARLREAVRQVEEADE